MQGGWTCFVHGRGADLTTKSQDIIHWAGFSGQSAVGEYKSLAQLLSVITDRQIRESTHEVYPNQDLGKSYGVTVSNYLLIGSTTTAVPEATRKSIDLPPPLNSL